MNKSIEITSPIIGTDHFFLTVAKVMMKFGISMSGQTMTTRKRRYLEETATTSLKTALEMTTDF